ncbi:MAG: response regulator [Ardenticatenaceae bacterium]|nr:response regulator [Ardenticatenaceae bacterium]HBY94500.1 hypothetical protein [Chloroflexota bacterium]
MASSNRVLIIDDQTAIVQLLEEFLSDEGYDVEGITDAVEALDRLHRPPRPDLLVLDLMMPQVTGWEVLDALRSDPATADVPVILLTAAPRQGQVEFTRRRPDHTILLAKPIGLDELLIQVAAMLNDREPPGHATGGDHPKSSSTGRAAESPDSQSARRSFTRPGFAS